MKNKNNKLIYITLVLVVVIFVFTIYTYYQTYFGPEYRRAINAQNANNICQAPSGYTEEAWREHMSHHPDIYRKCFE